MSGLKPIDDGRAGSPLDDTLLELAEGAIRELQDLTFRDCFCEDRENRCERCIAQAAVDKIERLAYPVVRSVASERRLYGAERVFFDRWLHVNKRVSGLNGGCGTLELIMSDDPNNYRAPISQRDMDVATAVIQWLGTSCGHAFVQKCEREIKRQRNMEYGEWQQFRLRNVPWKDFADSPDTNQLAQMIADKWGASDTVRRELEQDILGLLQYAVYGQGQGEALERLHKRL